MLARRTVEPREYCSLLLSRRRLERVDDAGRRTRGLYDPDTGTIWLVAESELAQALRSAGSADRSAIE